MKNFYFDSSDIPDFFCEPENYHIRSKLLLTYPLNHAAANGDLANVIDLINRGVEVDSLGDMGETPLHEAVLFGHIAIARELLNAGASISVLNNFGKSAVDEAIKLDNFDMLDLLINNKKEISQNSLDNFIEIYKNNYNFSCEKFDFESANDFGEFPIHIAVRRKSLKEVAAISNSGCNINAKTEDGMGNSALHYSVGMAQLDIVKFLLSKNADYELKDGFNRTPLDLAFLIGNSEQLFYLQEWIKNKISRPNKKT